MLAGCVCGMLCKANRSLHRADTDNTPRASHRPQLGSHTVHHASKVDTDDEIPLVIIKLLEHPGAMMLADDSCAIGTPIELAKLLNDGVYPGIYGFSIRYVELGEQ